MNMRSAAEAAEAADEFDPEADAVRHLDGLPKGFKSNQHGVHRREEKEGKERWAWLCSPIHVLALPRNASGTGWGRLIEVQDVDGRWHRFAVPATVFAGDGNDLRTACLDRGLRLSNARGARAAFSDLIARWLPKERATTSERLGWASPEFNAFLLGNGRTLGNEDIVYQSETMPEAALEMRPCGTRKEWREAVGALCCGNPLMIAVVSHALSGPFLEPLGMDGGGIHLRGQSSRGKTTLLRTAVSVWGAPGFLGTWRATTNGLEGIASACNSTLLALDEMGEVSGREAGSAAYMIANGTGKARATRTGSARPCARWKVAFLSSGEISLAEKVAEAGQRSRAGQEVRLLDIQADERAHGAFDHLHGSTSGAAFAERANRAAATAYGTAGPALVKEILKDLDGSMKWIRNSMEGFAAAAARRFRLSDADGQVERAVKRVALIAAAGEFATERGITGWQIGEAQKAAFVLLELWLAGRGGAGAREAREAIDRTRAFIVAHGSSRFERLYESPVDPQRIFERAGWEKDGVYYISMDVWHREIHAGADPKRAARHLQEAGLLVDGDGRNLKVRLSKSLVASRPRAYAVKAEIMGHGDD